MRHIYILFIISCQIEKQ